MELSKKDHSLYIFLMQIYFKHVEPSTMKLSHFTCIVIGTQESLQFNAFICSFNKYKEPIKC